MDKAVIDILEKADVAFQWPSTLLSTYHNVFFLVFLPITAGLIASVHARSLFLKGVVTGFLALLSGLEDLVFCILKYGSDLLWISWKWQWLLASKFFGGEMTTGHLLLWCTAFNLIILYWWKRI